MEGFANWNCPQPPIPDTVGAQSKHDDSEIKQYVKRLSGLPPASIAGQAPEFLEPLDPAANTIAYLIVLDTALHTLDTYNTNNRIQLLNKTIDFLMKFDPYAIRYVGNHLVSLLDLIASTTLFSPLIAVELLASTILRIDPTSSVFTSTHFLLSKLAFETNCIRPALKVIDRDISFYPSVEGQKEFRPLFDRALEPTAYLSPNTGLTLPVKSSTVIEYNLLCGMNYMALRDWAKAQKALERAISHPLKERTPSKIMTESYKKWMLVGLLNTGRPPVLPSHTAAAAKNAYTIIGVAYDNLANQFISTDAAQLKAEAETNQHVWEEDGNMLLVTEVLASYQKWQILNLRKVYQPVSVARIRNLTLSAETGQRIDDYEEIVSLMRKMMDSGMLQGDLQIGPTPEDSYFTFKEDDTSLSEKGFAREIATLHHNIQSLGNSYRLTNERLSSSKDYIRYVLREQKIQASKEEGDARKLEMEEDEDLMTGITPHS